MKPAETPHTPDDDTLNAWLDGELSPSERAALQARLAQDGELQARVAAWRQQRESLGALHREVLGEPVPAPLAAVAARLAKRQRERAQLWRLGGVAAGVLMAFGAGWLAHGEWGETPWAAGALAGAAPAAANSAEPARGFAQAALVAHAVYAPETRHPVEVPAAQEQHLVQWLSKRLGRPLKVPDLHTEGFELVGGRLLPGTTEANAARAQFMFESAAGERVTVYLGALPAAAAGEAATPAAFRWARDGELSSFYWVDGDFGYALAGPLARPRLLQLAEVVYRQLGG